MDRKIPISMPEQLKGKLEDMASEVGLSQNQLVVMAIHSLIANYQEKGSFIFADLLNPVHRNKR